MTKYLIFGAGWLGHKFKEYLGEDANLYTGRINDILDIITIIGYVKPEIIINCIGKTGGPPYNNIDWCEGHKEETFFSNVTVPTYIAEVCRELGIRMVHIGSGCIFSTYDYLGRYEEHCDWDVPDFLGSFYSRTKIYSEQILDYDNVLQLRIRMPIDNMPGKRNLIDKLIGYKQVIGDVRNSVTYIPDLLRISKELMDRKEMGIFNVVQKGYITHREILEMYKDIVDNGFIMPEFISEQQFEKSGLTIAKRSNCILTTQALDGIGIKVRDVRESIRDCLENYKKNKSEMSK